MEGSICFVSTKEGVIPCTLGEKEKKNQPTQKTQAVRRPGFSTLGLE